MKGTFEHFMAKEIFEQPDSIQGTMRGRIIPPSAENPYGRIHLGGLARAGPARAPRPASRALAPQFPDLRFPP